MVFIVPRDFYSVLVMSTAWRETFCTLSYQTVLKMQYRLIAYSQSLNYRAHASFQAQCFQQLALMSNVLLFKALRLMRRKNIVGAIVPTAINQCKKAM